MSTIQQNLSVPSKTTSQSLQLTVLTDHNTDSRNSVDQISILPSLTTSLPKSSNTQQKRKMTSANNQKRLYNIKLKIEKCRTLSSVAANKAATLGLVMSPILVPKTKNESLEKQVSIDRCRLLETQKPSTRQSISNRCLKSINRHFPSHKLSAAFKQGQTTYGQERLHKEDIASLAKSIYFLQFNEKSLTTFAPSIIDKIVKSNNHYAKINFGQTIMQLLIERKFDTATKLLSLAQTHPDFDEAHYGMCGLHHIYGPALVKEYQQHLFHQNLDLVPMSSFIDKDNLEQAYQTSQAVLSKRQDIIEDIEALSDVAPELKHQLLCAYELLTPTIHIERPQNHDQSVLLDKVMSHKKAFEHVQNFNE